MASGWGGLNSIIEEAKKRKEREDEEKKREAAAKEGRKALEEQRRQERESQNIRPTQPIPRPQTQQPSPYSSPPIDTGPASIYSSQEDDSDAPGRTRRSNIIQPVDPWSPPTIAPRQMAPSLSDRARGPYDAPNRPMVPTQAQPSSPEIDRWRPLSQWGQQQEPEGRPTRQQPSGYVEPQQQFSLTQQQQQQRQAMYAPQQNNWLDQAGSAIQQWGQDRIDQYTNTPEYQMAQARTEQRRQNELPGINQSMAEGFGMAGGLRNPVGALGGATLGGIIGGLNQTDWGREAVIRGQDVMDRLFEVPGMATVNAPIRGVGASISEFTTPLVRGMTRPDDVFRPENRPQEPLNLFGWLANYTMAEVAKTQNLRKRVQAYVEMGNPQANLALRNLPSGEQAVQRTLDLLVNRYEQANQLEQQAVAMQGTDPNQAGQLFMRAQELRSMSNADIVEEYMNPLAEFAYGMIADYTNVMGPVMGLTGLIPEAQAVRRAGKLVDVTPAQAITNLRQAQQRGTRLQQSLAQGGKAAQQTFDEIISPFLSPGERVSNVPIVGWLGKRTPESRASLDTEQLWQGLTGILSGITNKSDVKIVLDALVASPENLVRGVGNLSQDAMQKLAGSDGLVKWGPGLVSNKDFVRRLPILSTVQDLLGNMRSLAGEGMVNPYEFFSELHGIVYDGARRVNGGKQPTKLPFGATNVKVERLGQDSAILSYVDDKGKMIQRSVEMGLSEANRRVTEIQAALKPGGKGLLDYARIPADIQRAIMSDLWLGTRPANSLANALGAMTNLFANDSYTLLPNSSMQDYLGKKFGGIMPNLRLQESATGGNFSRTAGMEMGSGAVDKLAQLITRTPDNLVSQGMRKLYGIHYGDTQIKLPGGLAIPWGEGAFYTRAFYVPFMRAFNGGIVESINNNLVPRLQQMEGMTPQLIQQVGDWVTSLAQNGGKVDVATGIRKLAGKPELKMTLKQLGVPPELLSPQAARQIEQFIMDAAPSQAGQVMREISKILAGERNPPASMLNLASKQPGIDDWTDIDMQQEAAWLADSLLREAKKAGMDPAQIRQQMTDLTSSYVKGQAATYERLNGDLAGAPNMPDTWSIVMDFWQDVYNAKVKAHWTVDEAGQRAAQLKTPEAWNQKWQTTAQTYEGLRQQLQQLGEQSRTALQGVYNGTAYQPRHNWWETIEGYLGWDEEVLRQARTIELGSPDAADMEKWQQVIGANREYLDNSVYELFGSFQKYPSLQNFDIVRNGMQKVEYMGAQVRANLDVLLERLVAGEISKTQYAQLRNKAWNNYFDAGVQYNQHLGRAIIYNGLADQTTSGLKWTEGGTTWQLQEPSTTPGKWWARNEAGQKEEFSLAQTATEAGPFVVPKSVVDDYNRLAKNEKAIEAATDEVVREIAAPRGLPAPETMRRAAPVEIPTQQQSLTGLGELGGKDIADSLRDNYRAAVDATGKLPAPEYNNGRPTILAQVYERMVEAGSPRTSATLDEAFGVVERGKTTAGVGAEFTAWRNTRVAGPQPMIDEGIGPINPQVDAEVDEAVAAVRGEWRDELRARRDEVAAAYEARPTPAPEIPSRASIEEVVDVEFMPDPYRAGVPTPAPTAAIPSNNELRAAARDAGIATATKDGRATDRHLLASLNARMGSSAKKLDDLTEAQRLAALDVLAKRGAEPASARMTKKAMIEQYGDRLKAEQALTDERLSKMSKAEVGKRVDTLLASKPKSYRPESVEPLPAKSYQPEQAQPIAKDVASTPPQMGSDEPSYAPKPFSIADRAKDDVNALEQMRKDMLNAWNKEVVGAVAPTKGGKQVRDSFEALDYYVRRYGGDRINMNLDKGEVKMFEDLYGRTVYGMPINNLDDVERFFQQYADTVQRIRRLKGEASYSKQFAKMSAPEIIDATRDELLAAGLTPEDLVELATLPRRSVLDTIESIRGETPSEPGMVAYDFEVQSVAQLLGFEPAESEIGKTIREWINRTRRTGNNSAPQMADIAQVQIRSLNDLERSLRARMPEILQGVPNQLNGAQRLQVVDAVMDWLPEFDNVLTKAQRVGDRMAGHMMLNYNDRRGIDTVLGLLTPYHYFWSRMPSRVLMGALSKPGLVNAYYEAKRGIALENEQADIPDRLTGTLPMPGFLKDTWLGNARINVSRLIDYAIPAQSYIQPNPFVEEDPNDNAAEQWAKQVAKWTPGLFPTHEALLDLLDGKMDKYYGDVVNEMLPIQPSSIYQRITGQMPAQNGVMARFGLGPDTADDGFAIDAYRARRAVSYIGVEEKLPEEIVKYADQVITNQSNGDPVEKDIPPEMLQQALDLAERGVKRAAEDRLAGRGSAFLSTMAVSPYPQAEQDMRQAQGGYFASEYNAETNPYGSKELQGDIVDATQLPNWWAKKSETPGLDGQISSKYDQIATLKKQDPKGNKQAISTLYDEIDALKEQVKEAKQKAEGKPPLPPVGPSIVPGQGQVRQPLDAGEHWGVYMDLPNNAAKAKYLREHPDFVEIYDANEVDKGREVDHWWEEEKTAGAGRAPMQGGENITYNDVKEDADYYFDTYLLSKGDRNFDAELAWLKEHPEFAEYEWRRYENKNGKLPWWYDEYYGEEGPAALTPAQARPSQPMSVADVLRKPYDPPGVGDNVAATPGGRGAAGMGGSATSAHWDAYFKLENNAAKAKYLRENPDFAEIYKQNIIDKGEVPEDWWTNYGAGGGGGLWDLNWDEYTTLGEDWTAKKQYMLDNPEFAKYYKDRYGNAWWEGGTARAASSYGYRSFGGGGGGGGGGGSYTPPSNPPNIYAQEMSRELQNWRPMDRWWPQQGAGGSMDWQRAGDRIAPDPVRKWQPPRF